MCAKHKKGREDRTLEELTAVLCSWSTERKEGVSEGWAQEVAGCQLLSCRLTSWDSIPEALGSHGGGTGSGLDFRKIHLSILGKVARGTRPKIRSGWEARLPVGRVRVSGHCGGGRMKSLEYLGDRHPIHQETGRGDPKPQAESRASFSLLGGCTRVG